MLHSCVSLTDLKLSCGSALTPHVSPHCQIISCTIDQWPKIEMTTYKHRSSCSLSFLFLREDIFLLCLNLFALPAQKKLCVYQQKLFLVLPVIFIKSFSSGETDPHSCWQTVFLPIFAGSTLTRYRPSYFLPLWIPLPIGCCSTEGGANYGVRELRGDIKTTQAKEALRTCTGKIVQCVLTSYMQHLRRWRRGHVTFVIGHIHLFSLQRFLELLCL